MIWSMKGPWRFLIFSGVALCLGACSKEETQPSEGESQANALLKETFTGSKDYWFAVEKLSGSEHYGLVQLHNPKISFSAGSVTETDRMNGITERCRLVVECDQSRSWDGKWSIWKDDTAGRAQFLNMITPSLGVGFWVIQFEKRNDEWHSRNSFPIHNLVQDQEMRDALMRKANIIQ
jgi:hypothetical protein